MVYWFKSLLVYGLKGNKKGNAARTFPCILFLNIDFVVSRCTVTPHDLLTSYLTTTCFVIFWSRVVTVTA